MNAQYHPLNPEAAAADAVGGDRYMVTASDLVRHFGIWQDRAARAPVYVLHRGRPRHVLTSIEVMDALCAQHGGDGSTTPDPAPIDALLDLTDDILLIADRGAVLSNLSIAARSLFGGEAQAGMAIDRLFIPAVTPMIRSAVERVLASGMAETLDLVVERYPQRHFGCLIAPFGRGIVLRLEDATIADDLAALRARHEGQIAAIAATPGIATATIGLRGYLEGDAPTLGALSGLAAQSLASVRFVSLVDIGSRPALGEAIEAVIAGAGPQTLAATLLVNRGDPLPVRIGLAAIQRGSAITGASAVVASIPIE